MTIRNKEMVSEGIKLFGTAREFGYLCSKYFYLKTHELDDNEIQDRLGFSKIQIAFLSALWDNPKYSEPYKEYPSMTIEISVEQWLFNEIRNRLRLDDQQLKLLNSVFNDLLKIRPSEGTINISHDFYGVPI